MNTQMNIDRGAIKKQLCFEELYRRNKSNLIRYAIKYLSDGFYAEDVVQDVFMGVFQQNYCFVSEIVALRFLYTGVRHRCIDLLRNKQISMNYENTYKVEAGIANDRYDNLQLKELFWTVENKISSLPPKCKQIFVLKYRNERSNPEISQLLGLSVRTVENQVYIARNILREYLKTYLCS